MNDATRRAWRELVQHFEKMDESISSWCFAPCEEQYIPDTNFYKHVVLPITFLNFNDVRNRISKYDSCRSALLDVQRLFGNAIRFNWDPRPGVEGGRSFRSIVLMCLQEFYSNIAGGKRVLAEALKEEGMPFVPCWAAFPGALTTFQVLEEFHTKHSSDTFTLYYRDGLYYPQDNYDDPTDYLDYVPAPVFLSDIFERLLVGMFRAPIPDDKERMCLGWYSSPQEVADDFARMLANADTYYGEDADVTARVARVRAAWNAHWAANAARLTTAVAAETAASGKKAGGEGDEGAEPPKPRISKAPAPTMTVSGAGAAPAAAAPSAGAAPARKRAKRGSDDEDADPDDDEGEGNFGGGGGKRASRGAAASRAPSGLYQPGAVSSTAAQNAAAAAAAAASAAAAATVANYAAAVVAQAEAAAAAQGGGGAPAPAAAAPLQQALAQQAQWLQYQYQQ